jgi:hypothetical protein
MDQMGQPIAGGTPSEDLLKRVCSRVAGSAGWMKFLGVLLIIDGVITAISVIGILICWLPIWLGVILFKAAGDAETASRGAPARLEDYVQKLNRFFLISGILALISLIIGLIVLFVAGMAVIWGALGRL